MKGNGLSYYGVLGIAVVVAIVFFVVGYYVHPASTVSTPTSITFYEALAPNEASFFQNTIIPQYEALNPNVQVTLVNLANANQEASDMAVLVQANSVGTSLWGLDNLVVGEDYYPGYLMNMSNITSAMLPANLSEAATSLINYEKQVFGGVYFIPFRSNVPLLWYNKTAFTAAGISSAPATYAQMYTDAQLIYNKTGLKGSVMIQGAGTTGEGDPTGASTGTELYQIMVQNGGNPFLLNDSGDVITYQYLYNLSEYLNPGYTNGYWGTYTGLANGQYDILDYQWPYIYQILTTAPYSLSNNVLGISPTPAGVANDNQLLGGDVLVIPKGATNVAALKSFANFLLSAQAQKETLINLSWVAINSAAYDNLPASVAPVDNALGQAIASGLFLRDPTPWITQWNVYASDAFQQIVEGKGSCGGITGSTYAQIPTVLNCWNNQMYNYLVSNYNTTVANQFEAGYYKPISV